MNYFSSPFLQILCLKNWFLAPIIREHLHHPPRSAGPAPSGSQYTLHWRTDHEMNNGADHSTLVTAHKYWEQLLPGITINTELCLNKLTQNEGPGKIKKIQTYKNFT